MSWGNGDIVKEIVTPLMRSFDRLPKETRKEQWGDDYNAVEELREKRRKRNQP